MGFITERKCIVCRKLFNIKEGKMYKAKNVRNRNCITCSKECSSTYNRIRCYAVSNYIKNMKAKDLNTLKDIN